MKEHKPTSAKWKRPGGKLREERPASLTDSKLLAILISTGIKGKPAQSIAQEVFERFGLRQMLKDELMEIDTLVMEILG